MFAKGILPVRFYNVNHFTHISYFVICAKRKPRAHLMSFITCSTPNVPTFTSLFSTSTDLHHFYNSQPVNSFIPLSAGPSTPPTSWQVQLNCPFRPYSLLRALMSNFNSFLFILQLFFSILFFVFVSYHILPILDNVTSLLVYVSIMNTLFFHPWHRVLTSYP